MNDIQDRQSSRRQWCSTAARSLALGGIAWLSISLLGRTSGRVAEDCPSDTACERCNVLASCRLPKSLAAKQRAGRKA
jgi:hypothetical protein